MFFLPRAAFLKFFFSISCTSSNVCVFMILKKYISYQKIPADFLGSHALDRVKLSNLKKEKKKTASLFLIKVINRY